MVLSLMIISLEVEEGSPVFEKLEYLAESFKSSDFERKVLPNCEHSADTKQPFDTRHFAEITITTYMASETEGVPSSVEENDGKKENKSMENLTESEVNSIDQKPYFSGNPAVEVTKGILHLYKINDGFSQDSIARSDLLCMLSVPAKMSCTDLLNFILPFGKHIEHIRIIRDSTPNLYMTLLKFKDCENAHEFYDMFNGKPFNTLEPEVCHLVYVCKVVSEKTSDSVCLPLEGATELPTCHICLERMDESVEGILTVLCNHSFHGSCLVKWQDSSCPVCRCLQTIEVLQDNKCFSCDSKESLWICLICGHIGCGRYIN
jgi:BRCA1-associated protein